MAEPFVGRGPELASIAELCRRARSQAAPAGALLIGPAGCGKSRLLVEVDASLADCSHLRMVGYEPERVVPLAAASDLLRALAAAEGQEGMLRRLLGGDLPSGGALDTVRVLEAAHRALGAMGPVLITIDDLQWADPVSIALSHYLVRAATGAGGQLVVLAAGRPSVALGGFAESLVELLPAERLLRIEMSPLGREDGLLLVQAVAPGLSRERAEEIVVRSEGSPFWIRTLARGHAASPDADDVLAARLRVVGPDARAMLAALALAARPILPDDLARLLEWPPERAEPALAELVTRGLAIEVNGAAGLTHDLIREAAERSLGEPERRRLHRRLATLLEAEGSGDVQALEAALVHRRAAGLDCAELALRVARSPRRRLLDEEGIAHLRRVAEQGDPAVPEVLELRSEIARIAEEAGNRHIALELWASLAEGHPDPKARAAARLAAGRAACELGRAAEARARLEGLRRARPSGGMAVAADALEATILIWLEQRIADGSAIARRAAQAAGEMAERAGGVERLYEADRRAYIDAVRARFDAAIRAADAATMLAGADEMVEAGRGFDESAYLDGIRHGGVALRELGRLPEAEARLRQAWQEARSRVLPIVEVDSAFYLARVLLDLGRSGEAEAVAAEAAEIDARIERPPPRGSRLPRIQGYIALSRGPWREATARLERLAADEPDPHARLHLEAGLALWLGRVEGTGRADEAIAHLAAARRSADAAGCPRCSADLKLLSAEALVRLGREEEGRRSLAAWATSGTPVPDQERMHRRWVDGLIAARLGRRDTAAEELTATVGEAKRLGWGLVGLWAGVDLARALAPRDRQRAVDILRGVVRTAEANGARTEAEVAERELRALGVRTWRRGTSRGDVLSSREREVAELVARGASNPDIARALFLSRKTVERHVSSALAKLGARNRAELAARMAAGPSGEGAGEDGGPPS